MGQQLFPVNGGQQDPTGCARGRGGGSSRSSWASGKVGKGNRSSGHGASRGNATWDDVWDGFKFPPDGSDAGPSGGNDETNEAYSKVKAAIKRQQQQQQKQQQQQRHQWQWQWHNLPALFSQSSFLPASYHVEVIATDRDFRRLAVVLTVVLAAHLAIAFCLPPPLRPDRPCLWDASCLCCGDGRGMPSPSVGLWWCTPPPQTH